MAELICFTTGFILGVIYSPQTLKFKQKLTQAVSDFIRKE